MRPDIKPGATFPDYELLDHENVPGASPRSRPDWDLSTPGLRDAWDAGDWSPFHGWNRRTPPTPSAA